MSKRAISRITVFLLLIVMLTIASNTWSFERALAQTSGLTDTKELETFLDGLITAHLKAYYIQGATTAVVKDGQLFFAKGYGYADLKQRKPIVANRTLFRVASVSKLFTWTAVMQFVEQGKLDLNADINTYLNTFKIPDTFLQPITLIHLMTHTSGFEDKSVGTMARSADDLVPLGEFLALNMPARVRPPGEFSAYSNYGTALAGYIVEKVSGIPFEQYVEEHILNPLEMHSSTFRQPLPTELAADLAVGYTYASGAYHPEPVQYTQLPPATSMSTTASDMAKFMIAHLQNGLYKDARILQDSTAQQMHRQLFTHDPRVSGWAYGFMEMNLNNQRMIWHAGTWAPQFYTLLVLLPEQNVGLFVSYNSAGGADARYALLQAFLDRYYPAPASAVPQPLADFQQRANQFTGSYRMTSSAYTTFAKLINLFAPVDVTANPDGTLLITGLGALTRWVEVEPLVFLPTESQPSFYGALVFRKDDQGRVTHFFLMNYPLSAFERVPWYETVAFNFSLLGVCIALFLSALVLWPISFFIHRRRGKPGAPSLLLPRLAPWFTGGGSAMNMLSFIGLLIGASNTAEFGYGIPPFFIALPVILLIASGLAVVSVIFTVLAWKNRYWGLLGRVHYTLVTLVALAFVWWLNNWNLLGFHF